MARHKTTDEDIAIAAGGAALVASILGNLQQHSSNTKLRRSVEALQRLVADWQTAYHDINGQLAIALRTNEEQTRLIGSLRQQLDELKSRAYGAEQRALEAEAELDKLRNGANGHDADAASAP